MSDAYDMIDRFLRNNLGSDDDYAEYSKALDSLCRAQPAQAGQDFTEQLREVARRAGTPTDHACDCGRKWKHTTYGWASTEPAQAGQVLTDDRLLAMWEGTDGERALRPTLGKNKILSFAHAIEQAVMAKRVPQWLPIETAPKDFVSEFDGWNGERVPNVSWAHPEYSPKGHFDWCVSEYETGHGWVNVAVKNLTHWMPLPPPPGIVGEKGGA